MKFSRSMRRLSAGAALVLLGTVTAGGPVGAQQDDGPEERDPVEAIAGVPVGEVCALQGTLVLAETVARSSLPPEVLRTIFETLGVPFGTACTLVPPRDRLTKCTGDKEVGEISQGLVGAAPVGDTVQIVEEVESVAGVDGALSQAAIDALACEQFEFGQGDTDGGGDVFVPPARPTTPPAPTNDGAGSDDGSDGLGAGGAGSAGGPGGSGGLGGGTGSGSGTSGGVSTGATGTPLAAPVDTSGTTGDNEVASPAIVEAVASIGSQIDLFAVLVCMALTLATIGALLPEGRLAHLAAGVRRRRDRA